MLRMRLLSDQRLLSRQNSFSKLPGNRILLEQIGHPWAVVAQLDQMFINSGEDPVTIRDLSLIHI